MANLLTKKRIDPSAQTHSQSNNESNLQSLSNTWSDMSSLLKEDQLQAHNIVNDHLTSYLNGKQQPQLLMVIIGQEGTALNNSIIKTFKEKKVTELLAKTVTMGIASILITGITLHW